MRAQKEAEGTLEGRGTKGLAKVDCLEFRRIRFLGQLVSMRTKPTAIHGLFVRLSDGWAASSRVLQSI